MQPEEIYRPPQADLEIYTRAEPKELAPFFQTAPSKVLLYSLASFGIYALYWFYQQWDQRKSHGEDVAPLARGIFSIFFAYSLFKSVNQEIEVNQEIGRISEPIKPLAAGVLAILFIVPNFLWRLPDALGFIGILSFLSMMIAQRKINELHAALGYDTQEGMKHSVGGLVLLVVGTLWWMLVLIGLFMPPAA